MAGCSVSPLRWDGFAAGAGPGVMLLLLLLLATWLGATAIATTTGAAGQREAINFDFAWRNMRDDAGAVQASGGGFDDSNWTVVDCPHDQGIEGSISYSNPADQGFYARPAGWYRKHFTVPAEWQGSSIWLYVEGSFHITNSWLNSVHLGEHRGGYTSFELQLSDGLVYGGENVLSLHVDATNGTGWWYEGGGLMRHMYLVKAAPLHVLADGAWAYANVTTAAALQVPGLPSSGMQAGAVIHCQTTVANDAAAAVPGVSIAITVHDMSGAQVAAVTSASTTVVGKGSQATLSARASVPSAHLWSVVRPYLYTLVIHVLDQHGVTQDSVNVTMGIRSIVFDADKGLLLNGAATKVRGFCDHSNFGGVGGAVPDRVNLFRAQLLRSVGGNAWRMAHNPPVPSRLDIMDRLGMLAMDENRDYGGILQQGGLSSETLKEQIQDMGDLVQRDRSHPSVMLWSFCVSQTLIDSDRPAWSLSRHAPKQRI